MAVDKERMTLLNQYYQKSKKKCLALRDWLQLQGKSFDLVDALDCIYNAANGKVSVMDDMITRLTDKKKVYGRTQYSGSDRAVTNGIDIRKGEDGRLELLGYSPDVPLTLKGQHLAVNPNITRKKDGHVRKDYINTRERLFDIGAWVRKAYPSANVVFIARAIESIRKFAAEHKMNWIKVCQGLDNGKLLLNSSTMQITPKTNETYNRREIIITEDMVKLLEEETKMTEYRFNSNLRFFLRDLLIDPMASQLPTVFSQRGYTKSRFIQILINNGILEKKERISDKDENGEPKKATMMVSYRIPSEGLKRKIKKLYIKMFERNIPERPKETVNEDGEGAVMAGATTSDSSGQYTAPLFGIQRRKMPTVETTTTTTVGDYQYTVPFPGDDETLARHNGVGGSVSINHKNE